MKEIEEYFEFIVENYIGIWFLISFVLYLGFWNNNEPHRLDYEQLRLGTLAIIYEIIVIMLTGKVQQRVMSRSMQISILDSIYSNGE